MVRDLTQQQKIVAIMCINKDKKWWKPHEIMNIGIPELFVGYEASARLSELAKEQPAMIESKREGKYILRRIRFETGRGWYGELPAEFKQIFKKYYRKDGVA